MPRSVLFVCMGNICRSPTGEGVLQALVDSRDLASRVRIDSAGTIGYHEGNPADARMRAAAARRNYELRSRARRIERQDLFDFDLVIAMDRENLKDVLELDPAPSADIRLLSHFLDASDADWPDDVPDPYYGGPDGFEYVLDMIEAACPSILDWLLESRPRKRT